ncbi:MAG: DUF2612 domain-containing protein [Oscillospiraceae bacterium]|nr:DUF2612 domain-containing protein [Oscillospiraceae bacterium]
MDLLDEALVPSHSRGMPKFMAFLRLILRPLEDTAALIASFENAFDVTQAVGPQLDMLGALVGASRELPFAPASASRILSDEDYRMLIRAAIARNVWNGTNKQAMDVFSGIFSDFGIVLQDHQDCSINLVISTIRQVSELRLEMLNAGLLIPVPAGVALTYEIPETVETAAVTVRAGVYTAGRIIIEHHEE